MENKLKRRQQNFQQLNNLSTELNSAPKQRASLLWPILVTLLVSSLIFGLAGYYLGKPSSSRPLTSTAVQKQPTPTITSQPPASPAPLQESSQTVTFQHEYLPGFDIVFLDDWKLDTKQFQDKDSRDFVSTYFPTCHERCMGVRLSKSDVSLDILFDVAFDNNAFKCSNSVVYQEISNGWYRIKDSQGYFYTRNVELNKALENGKFPSPYGKASDEWSAIAGTTYKICVQGSGDFLNQYSEVETGETGDGVPILMEFPKVKGNPDDNTLTILDNMVSSIKGLGK